MFCHFGQNFENSKWPPFLGRGKFFENCRVQCSNTLWVENFDEIALSGMVKEIEENWSFLAKIRKFKMAAIFLKIAKITFLRYPVGQKFRRNRSISHG